MKVLTRYVALTLLANVGVSLAALLAIFSVITLMEEMGDVGTGAYGLQDALAYVALTLPHEAYELVPPAALLGGVNALGTLAARREIVALWSAGLSRGWLIGAVLRTAAVLVVAAGAFGELAAAPLAQHAHRQRSVAMSGGGALSSAHGFWLRDRTRFINVRSPLAGNHFGDLYVFDFDARHHLRSFRHARAATYHERQWTLEDVTVTELRDEAGTVRHVASETWPTLGTAPLLRRLLLPTEFLALADLLRAVRTLRTRGESAARHEAALLTRASQPLVTGLMLFLAVPLVLTFPRAARTGQRIAVAALLGVGFQMFSQTFSQAAIVYGLPVLPALALPPALALAAGLWLLQRLP
jgi:lipopolysaccharide export system permease protein